MAATPTVSKKMFVLTLKQYGYAIAESAVRCLPDYLATLRFIADGTLVHAKQKGFYCFGEARKQSNAEVVAGGDDFVESGPRIRRLEEAFRKLAAKGGELRVLHVSALAVEAVWRHDPSDAANDMFVPYASSVKAIVPLETYSNGSFLAILRPLAERKLLQAGSIQPF